MQSTAKNNRKRIKIVYALTCFEARSSGVYWKIKDQLSIWKNDNIETQLVVITDHKSADLWLGIDRNAILIFDRSLLSKVKNRFRILKVAIQQKPDVLYFRDNFPIYIPNTNFPLVIEVQSLVKNELRARGNLRFLAFRLFRNLYYRNITAAVFVSRELQQINEINLKTSHQFHISGNGIDIDRVTELPVTQDSIELLFIGHPNQPWHGIEDIFDLASIMPKFKFHIIGYESGQTSENVFSYKELERSEYLQIAERCTLGISTLKLNIKGMAEASPLKSREYLAMGLPIISRYEDTDFSTGKDFILQLPNDSRKLTEFAGEIETFAYSWRGRRVKRSDLSVIDVKTKERARLDFFYSLLP